MKNDYETSRKLRSCLLSLDLGNATGHLCMYKAEGFKYLRPIVDKYKMSQGAKMVELENR